MSEFCCSNCGGDELQLAERVSFDPDPTFWVATVAHLDNDTICVGPSSAKNTTIHSTWLQCRNCGHAEQAQRNSGHPERVTVNGRELVVLRAEQRPAGRRWWRRNGR